MYCYLKKDVEAHDSVRAAKKMLRPGAVKVLVPPKKCEIDSKLEIASLSCSKRTADKVLSCWRLRA